MKKLITYTLLYLFIQAQLIAQNLPDSRKVDWSICGYEGKIPCQSTLRNVVTEFGINNNGTVDVSTVVNNALNSIKVDEVLYFPAGTYLFNKEIIVPAHRVIRGESASATVFKFDFTSTNACISVKGSTTPITEKIVTAIGTLGESTITVENTAGLSVGSDIEIEQENDPTIHGAEDPNDLASWATNLKGQLAKIKAINGNIITLDRTLIYDYDLNFSMTLRQLNLTEQVGLENFKLIRLSDNGIGAGNNNIWISYAKNCWVRKVHLEYSSRYHFQLDHARNIEVNEVFMDKAYSCGSGGAGYGLLVQEHVSESLFENNIAYSLRHPWIAKEGCGRNVYAYNFSSGTTQGNACDANPLTDSYADISLHGHYPAFNLFEGNVVYRISSSDAWGPNGPGNTFLRNRVLGQKGIWIQSYSYSQNVMGNELTHPSAQFEMNRDNTVDNTTLHYSNYNTKGLIDDLAPNSLENSYYKASKPDFFGTMAWPAIGPGVAFNTGEIPAQKRFNSGNYFSDTPVCAACAVPNLGVDQSLCGLPSITLNSQLNASKRTFQWFKDNQKLNKTTASISIDKAGVYTVKVDSSGCLTEDNITISATIGIPDLGVDQTLCNPAVLTLNTQLTGDGLTYKWFRDNRCLTSNTSSTLSVSAAGTYRAAISADGCATVSDEIVISSNLLPVIGDTLCTPGKAIIEVALNGSYSWFNQPKNGVAFSTTDRSTLVNVQQSTIFYVEDATGVSAYVGKKVPILTNGMAYTDDRFDRKLAFTVLSKIKLDSLSIWSKTATAVTVRILADDNLTEVATRTFNNITLEKENRLGIDVELTPGNYFLDFVGTNGTLYYSNEKDLTINYPYSVTDLITIVGASPAWVTDKPYYMFAYNWKITAGNTCARTPVKVIVDASLDQCLVSASSSTVDDATQLVFPNPSHNGFKLNNNASATLRIYSIAGTLVESITINKGEVFGKNLEQGTYFIHIEKDDVVQTLKIIKY